MGIDPLAASGGQDMFSPYAAMGNNPGILTDPEGLLAGLPFIRGGGNSDIGSAESSMFDGSLGNMPNQDPNGLFPNGWTAGGGGLEGLWARRDYEAARQKAIVNFTNWISLSPYGNGGGNYTSIDWVVYFNNGGTIDVGPTSTMAWYKHKVDLILQMPLLVLLVQWHGISHQVMEIKLKRKKKHLILVLD